MNKKVKNGFISMTLVYTFLVLFMFVMLAILRTYTEKDKFLQAINDQIDSDIGKASKDRISIINKIIDLNMPTSDNVFGIKYFKISNSHYNNGNSLFYMDKLYSDFDLLAHTDENADGHTSRIYYFRGDVENNHIVFANMCFRIIRTNEDGSIRLKYNGEYDKNSVNKCPTTSDVAENIALVSIGYESFSENTSFNASSFANSEVMKKVNDWYYSKIVKDKSDNENNPLNRYYTENVSNTAVYCFKNSEELKPSFINPLNQAPDDNNIKNNLSLKCENSTDRFILGDTRLYYPVGLLTAQDVVLAGGYLYQGDNDLYKGGSFGITNTGYYMYSGGDFWTMSSYGNSGKMLYVAGGNDNDEKNGALIPDNPNEKHHIIPVISIGPDISIETGSGLATNPYIVRK